MRHFTLLLIVVACVSCVNELESIEMDNEMEPTCLNDLLNLTDGVIIGQKLRNPYSIKVMKEACDLLYPPTRGETPASDTIVVPNVKYVRFLPADSTEFRLLMESGLELFNYPLDYEILGNPSDYRDPSLSPYRIQWQYTVMPINQVMPIGNGEILEEGYLPELDMPNRNVDLTNLEQTAIGIVLNKYIDGPKEDYFPYEGGASSGGGATLDNAIECVTGRITMDVDNLKIGVKGVKVRARNFFKIRTAYTDNNGKYFIDLDGIETPWYELRFHNRYNFEIGYGIQVIMPMSTFMYFNPNFFCTEEVERKSWVACMLNNVAYDWYERCKLEGMPTPPDDMYIWAIEEEGGAACPMLHHGVLAASGLVSEVIGETLFGEEFSNAISEGLEVLVEMVGPDIVVRGVDNNDEEYFYKYLSHELAHATHFKQLGTNDIIRSQWWSYVFNYEVACILLSFDDPYEHPSVPREERAGIAEMWAHAVGYICKYEHCQRNVADYRDRSNGIYDVYWFAPEIILDLYERGMTLKQISDCMTEDVITFEDFRETLIVHNSTYASRINYLFDNYLDD